MGFAHRWDILPLRALLLKIQLYPFLLPKTGAAINKKTPIWTRPGQFKLFTRFSDIFHFKSLKFGGNSII